MAVSVEQWFYEELSKLGMQFTEENVQYILSMQDEEDMQEYMNSLMDVSQPAVKEFLSQFKERWRILNDKTQPSTTILAHEQANEKQSDNSQVKSKKKIGKKNKNAENIRDDTEGSTTVTTPSSMSSPVDYKKATGSSISIPHVNGTVSQESYLAGGQPVGQGAKRKNKFVPLYSQQGKEKLVITLPGRIQCECQALKHQLVNNCSSCGRVVCKQEGAGPCLFCGRLVCSPEDQEIISRGSKKGEKLHQFLMRDADKFVPLCRGSLGREILPSVSARMQEGREKAERHKDRLLEFDRTSVRRTHVIDDECDYFSTDSNQWISREEREALRKREEELRAVRFASRKDRKFTLDFAGRQVIEEANIVGETMYNHKDAVVEQVQYGQWQGKDQGDSSKIEPSGNLVNPSIMQPAPQFVPDCKTKTTKHFAHVNTLSAKSRVPIIQDRELNEMSDEGMCLSMHQPWASLLVAGIKIHEGRSWYTAHRGRLWIAATVQSPAPQEVAEMENHYRFFYQDARLEFPKDYPVGCLLGCVDLVDCLSQEDYREKFPEGESASPYVFICENPQELVIKFPIKGKHKIYKLDSAIHQAAKKGLR